MFEIGMLAGWLMLWGQPRWSALNKGGIVLVLALAPMVLLVWFLTPDFRRMALIWSVAYVLIFLGIGALTILWRIRSESALARHAGDATGAWAPTVWKVLPVVAKWSAGLALFSAVLVASVALVSGHFNLRMAIVSALLGILPIVPALYAACIVSAADLLTAPTRQSD